MATQGLLSIVQNGQTAWKVVTGSDGYNIPKLAFEIAYESLQVDMQRLYDKVCEHFKPSESLFVIGPDGHLGGDGDELPPLYRKTFYRPEFNPRWHLGAADYAMIYNADFDVLRVVRGGDVVPVDRED